MLQETSEFVELQFGRLYTKLEKLFVTEQKELLTGIFEIDETFVKINKNNIKDDDQTITIIIQLTLAILMMIYYI